MADSDVIRPTGYTSDSPNPDPEYTSDPPNPDQEPDQEAGCGADGEDFDAAAGGDAADEALMQSLPAGPRQIADVVEGTK